MYRQIVHFLQGQVLVRIECGCPERVLNLCGARGIPFWELTWESPVCLTLRAVGRDLPRLRQAAEDAGGQPGTCAAAAAYRCSGGACVGGTCCWPEQCWRWC